MTERRSHWDDDLIVAVGDAIEHAGPTVYPTVGMVNDVIAAVEDWQERKGEENLPLLMAMMNAESTKFRRRAEKADAAIKRVRELCERSRAVVRVGCRCCTDECSGTCGAGEPLAWDLDPDDVLRALEDECPTCEGPIRETVGLVCQTCGTDYGAQGEYAAQHGWEVGSHLRYAGGVGPSSVITSIEADEVRISTPGDFPGRLTRSTRLEKWTLDWQYRAEKAEATIARVRQRAGGPTPAVHGDWMAGYAAAMRDILSALDGTA